MTERERRRRRLADAVDINRLHIFVPAVMSVGLVFWVASELRDLVRASRDESRDKRATLASDAVAATVLGRPPTSDAQRVGLRSRPVYLVLALCLLGLATYLSVGVYVRQQRSIAAAAPGVSGEAWLLALGACAACVLALYGVVALAAFVRWGDEPAWVRGMLLRSPLTTRPIDPLDFPGIAPRWVRWGLGITTVASVVLTVFVGWLPGTVTRFDERVAEWIAGRDPLDVFGFLDPLGKTEVALVLAVLAGLAALRCRVLATSYAAATVVGLLWSLTARPLVARARPPGGDRAGALDSYPSGHMILSVLFAGAMPLAIAVLADRRWIIRPLRIVLAVGVAAGAMHRVSASIHWPSDVLGGALIGASLVFAVEWAVDTERAHRLCHDCMWSHGHDHARPGAVPMHLSTAQRLRLAGHVTAAAAAVGLAVLTLTLGLPANTEGFVFAESVQRPAQLALAGLVSVGALVAWRWDAVGAVLIALAAVGLGLFASVQYPAAIAVLVTVALLVPAVLLWLSWQHRRRPWEILTLALVTTGLVAGTWVAAASVYDTYFGPTHPASSAPLLPVDRVEWVWSGALSSTGITVSTRLAGGMTQAGVVVEAVDSGATVASPVVPADEHGIVQVRVDGLDPDTAYRYRVLVDGVVDTSRGEGTFRTPRDGAMSFRVVVASCARVGSNGAVFDAIRAEDPLLYLALGDIHYGNLDATTPGPFLDAYDRLLTAPGQAALYRDVPIAYVWDDHDYGPDNADASAPGRSAARAAYRTVVPHYPIPQGDAPIYQAFTIGRVRFVMTDGRSERTADTLLGETQLEWLLAELRDSSQTHALVVWANSVPWIGEAVPGADSWAGYPEERRTIADAIAAAGITNLVMVSGDAHMVAIDDGTNSDYSTGGGGGFPVLHAAALDRPGNVKGGPYSEGAFPGGGQYGLLEITDDGGDTIEVRLAGRQWTGDELVSLTVSFTG